MSRGSFVRHLLLSFAAALIVVGCSAAIDGRDTYAGWDSPLPAPQAEATPAVGFPVPNRIDCS